MDDQVRVECPEDCESVFVQILMELKYLRRDFGSIHDEMVEMKKRIESGEKFRWMVTGGVGFLSVLSLVLSIFTAAGQL